MTAHRNAPRKTKEIKAHQEARDRALDLLVQARSALTPTKGRGWEMVDNAIVRLTIEMRLDANILARRRAAFGVWRNNLPPRERAS